MALAKEVAEGACSTARLSDCSLTVPELRQHIKNWRASNYLADDVIGWKGRYSSKELMVASRPGAWMADFFHTCIKIEKVARPRVKYLPVLNATYVELAKELGLIQD